MKKATLAQGNQKVIGPKVDQTVFPVKIDYDLSLEEMIEAGKYDWVNSDIIVENFPIKGSGLVELEIELVHFGRYINSEAALKELDQMDLRPATLPELLAFGAAYPEIQREFPIVALGSVWQRPGGGRGVPCLWCDSDGRNLGLRWLDGGWHGRYRFASIRK